ncbi:MAG: hypothetical protein AAF587_15165 [Bacteroidota bacterium]
MKDEFFVGYTEDMPPTFRKNVSRFVWIVGIALPVIGALVVLSQRGFSTGTYELGSLTKLQGVVFMDPVPSMRILGTPDAQGVIPSQTVLLMSFGKFGAEKDLEAIAERVKTQHGKGLSEVLLTLEGTLDYRDGKTMFELSKNEASLLDIQAMIPNDDPNHVTPKLHSKGEVSLTGEIVDSKCYFGTMKPGEGKPHRSCAIRCISGGIPPILMVTNEVGQKEAYLLRGPKGEAIGKEVLDVVADPVEVSGILLGFDHWNILQVDPKTGIRRIE